MLAPLARSWASEDAVDIDSLEKTPPRRDERNAQPSLRPATSVRMGQSAVLVGEEFRLADDFLTASSRKHRPGVLFRKSRLPPNLGSSGDRMISREKNVRLWRTLSHTARHHSQIAGRCWLNALTHLR